MKFCPRCGAPTDETASFCAHCGAAFFQVSASPGFSAPPETAVVDQRASVLAVIRTLCRSPLFIAGAVAFCLSGIIDFVRTFFVASVSSAALVMLESLTGQPASDAMYLSPFSIALSLIPNVLIAAGLWMTYAACDRRRPSIATNGLTMIRVVYIIVLVFLCIIAAAALPIMLVAGGYGLAGAMLAVTLFLLLGVIALLILFFAKVLSSLKTVRRSILSGTASDRVSTFVAVMLFVFAGFGVLSLFLSLSDGAGIGLLSDICSVTMAVCFALLIVRYQKAMREIMYAAPSAGSLY